MARNVQGTIYLLHFERRYKGEDVVVDHAQTSTGSEPVLRPRKEWPGAQHYCGWAVDLERRLAEHASGQGARLVAVMVGSGISFTLAKTWAGDRNEERRLKNRGGASRICPICRGEKQQ